MFNIIPNPWEKRGLKKAYLTAFFCLIAITYISHLLPGKIKVDVLYVCCVLLVVGQTIRRIIIYSLVACCLILVTHLTLNRTLPLSWVAFVNAGISIIAALITSYVANGILNKNKLLEHHVAERANNLSEVNHFLEESQAQLRTIFNTTEIAFLLLDSDLRILTFNAIADHWSELSFETKLKRGILFWDLLNEERNEPVREMMLTAMTGKAINYEASYALKTGTPEWYQISMNPVKDQQDQIIGLCCSAINITLEKSAEIAHSRITDELIRRNKDLEQFSYIVSHNLRAPLANINGLSQMLQQDGLPQDEKMEIENLLFQSIARLNEIVEDLNHVLQDRRQINENKEQVDFSALLGEVLTGFQAAVERENIQVLADFSEANSLLTIKAYLYNIFFNLLSNSIKYRQPGIPAKVEIKTWKEGRQVIILFKDNGRGINLRGKGTEVFGLYKRFHPDVDGKGLGLFMVNYQVETLGGHIDIQSRQGVGTTFIITLP